MRISPGMADDLLDKAAKKRGFRRSLYGKGGDPVLRPPFNLNAHCAVDGLQTQSPSLED